MATALLERARMVEDARKQPVEEVRLTVDDLRRSVWRHVSLDSVRRMMEENPERAKAELRAACKQAFVDANWAQLDFEEKQRLVNELLDHVFGMGPLESLIRDESVTEIMVNGAKSVYCERNGKLERCGFAFSSDDQVRMLIDRILGPLGRRIDEASPMVSARLPQGHRVHAVLPPLALDGPALTIRAFARKVLTLDEMVRRGSFDDRMARLLRWAVLARKSIAVSGGTGSGKTTLLNALSCEIPHGERIVTIEDAAELKFETHPHVVRLEARPRNAEGIGEVTIRDLVINSLRMRPDRIVVGECRGGEALDMLQAMNTGHDGSLTTLHANSSRDVVERMVTMVRYAVDLPVDAIEAQIGSAFDLVVHVARSSAGMRYVAEVIEVGFDRDLRRCSMRRLYSRSSGENCGSWEACPAWLDELPERGLASDEEVTAWKQRL